MSTTKTNHDGAVASVPPPSESGAPHPRRTVTTTTSYTAAERAVDWLSDQGFAVEHVSIVGTGLRYVEQVSRRMTTGRAALIGIGYGALLGLVWGLLFGALFTTDDASFWGLLGFSILVGVVFGGLAGAISQASSDGKRDFSSTAATRADRYEVQVDDGYASEAQRLLATMPAT
jgi:Heat induced stress protein YflT domain